MISKKEILTAVNSSIFKIISEEAESLSLRCFVIGGWVRDLIMNRPSNDIDVVVVGSGIDLAERVKNRLGKKSSMAVFKTYGTAQVKIGNLELEFVGARKESYHTDSRNPLVSQGTLEDDQNRRDFTINALAISLNKESLGELLDPFNGLNDIEHKRIITPLDPDITFSDDPLRMMRAIRFASQLDFSLSSETFDSIYRNRERINIITKERIVEELNKIILSSRPSVGLKLLDMTGLLPLIFPELAALKGTEIKDGHSHKDVFLHTLKVVDNISRQTTDLWLPDRTI